MESRSALHEFLKTQHADLASRSVRLRSQLNETENELTELKKAAAAIGLTLSDNKPEVESNNSEEDKNIAQPTEIKSTPIDITMKKAAEEILEAAKDGLTVGDILIFMKRDYGLPYPRSSLSPQLSRLKQEGLVVQKGRKWILKKFADGALQLGAGVFG